MISTLLLLGEQRLIILLVCCGILTAIHLQHLRLLLGLHLCLCSGQRLSLSLLLLLQHLLLQHLLRC